MAHASTHGARKPPGPIDSQANFSICTDPALYDTEVVTGIQNDVVKTSLKSCTKSVISYGPLHVYDISKGKLKPAPPPGLGGRAIIRFPDHHTRNVAYVQVDFIALLGSIGGYLGLYLGVSLWQLMDVLPWLAGTSFSDRPFCDIVSRSGSIDNGSIILSYSNYIFRGPDSTSDLVRLLCKIFALRSPNT